MWLRKRWLVCIACLLVDVSGKTRKDDSDRLRRGNGRILLGAISGDVSSLRLGYAEAGNVNAVLEPFFGEMVLDFGKAYIDFPICPALHLAINLGQRQHLDCALYLMKMGADINAYIVPEFSEDPPSTTINNDASGRKFMLAFPPGILYALGLGQLPLNTHAGLLQRLYHSMPHKFNRTKLEEWRLKTGNPPLSHIAQLAGNIDGLHWLVSDFRMDVVFHERDQKGLSALHIAVWIGDIAPMAMLLHQSSSAYLPIANPHLKFLLGPDNYGRIPLHYAVLRGNVEAVDMLLLPPPSIRNATGIKHFVYGSLHHRDLWGCTPFELALCTYPQLPIIVDALSKHAILHHIDLSEVDCAGRTNPSEKRLPNLSTTKAEKYENLVKMPKTDFRLDNACFLRCERSRTLLGCDASFEESDGWNSISSADKLDCMRWQSCERKCTSRAKPGIVGVDTAPVNVGDDSAMRVSTISAFSLLSESETLEETAWYREHVVKQRPVLITDHLTAGEGTRTSAMWAFRDKDTFLDRFGAVELETGGNIAYQQRTLAELRRIRETEIASAEQKKTISKQPRSRSSSRNSASRSSAIDSVDDGLFSVSGGMSRDIDALSGDAFFEDIPPAKRSKAPAPTPAPTPTPTPTPGARRMTVTEYVRCFVPERNDGYLGSKHVCEESTECMSRSNVLPPAGEGCTDVPLSGYDDKLQLPVQSLIADLLCLDTIGSIDSSIEAVDEITRAAAHSTPALLSTETAENPPATSSKDVNDIDPAMILLEDPTDSRTAASIPLPLSEGMPSFSGRAVLSPRRAAATLRGSTRDGILDNWANEFHTPSIFKALCTAYGDTLQAEHGYTDGKAAQQSSSETDKSGAEHHLQRDRNEQHIEVVKVKENENEKEEGREDDLDEESFYAKKKSSICENRECASGGEEPFKLGIGGHLSGAPMHSHNSSWNVLLVGKKVWYFAPPAYREYIQLAVSDEYISRNFTEINDAGIPYSSCACYNDVADEVCGSGGGDEGQDTGCSCNSCRNISREGRRKQLCKEIILSSALDKVPAAAWILCMAPILQERGLLTQPKVQNAGDVIYIPHDWLHVSINLVNSLSLSQEICTFQNTDHRLQPLGLALYGGNDPHRRMTGTGIGSRRYKAHLRANYEPRVRQVTRSRFPIFDYP